MHGGGVVEWEWGREGGWEWVLEGGDDHAGGWDRESVIVMAWGSIIHTHTHTHTHTHIKGFLVISV